MMIHAGLTPPVMGMTSVMVTVSVVTVPVMVRYVRVWEITGQNRPRGEYQTGQYHQEDTETAARGEVGTDGVTGPDDQVARGKKKRRVGRDQRAGTD